MKYQAILKSRYKIILTYTSVIIFGVAILNLLPLIFLFFDTSDVQYVSSFIYSAIISFLVALFLLTIGDRSILKSDHHVNPLTQKEGGIIVLLVWIISTLLVSLPYLFWGKLNFTQSYFEGVSGLTTTGLSMVDVTQTPKIFLAWRSLTQFVGGAGFAVIMLSSIIGPGGLGLYYAEGRSEQILPNIVNSTKIIMFIYSFFITSGVIIYTLLGMPFFDAINHSIAALSTGGFSTQTNSIGEYNNFSIELFTILLMLIGTTNFAALYLLFKKKFREFFKISEIRFGILLILIFPLLMMTILLPVYSTMRNSMRISSFQTISAISTTGFSTVSFDKWSQSSVFIMIVLMMIGGGTGSTAGGIKQYRIFLLLKSLWWNFQDYISPQRKITQHKINKPEGIYYVQKKAFVQNVNFISLYLFVYIIGVLILTMNGYSLIDSMFEYASCLSTVGLSVGLTSPNANGIVLWTEIIGMFLGRLEFLIVFFSIIKMFKDMKEYKQSRD
jgi:trk system potassium uptake protein TrkH